MCIYYGDSPELTYVNREHVFPAGLGGIHKLEKGVVSDQANALFSKMEMKLMRQSLVSFYRILFGPGDRGSLVPNKASKSLVTVGHDEDGNTILSYFSDGKPQGIPQVLFSGKKYRISLPTTHADLSENKKLFLSALQKYDNKFVYLNSSFFLPVGEIIVGYFEGKYYVGTSDGRPEVSKVKKAINSLLQVSSSNDEEEKVTVNEHMVEQEHIMLEDQEIARMYAKTAMNVIALIMGAEYAANPQFDDIRNWIITGESKDNYSYLPVISIKKDHSNRLEELMPPDSHWCLFMRVESNLEAIVCFYNKISRRFTLGEMPDTKCTFPFGFICDWRNEREYTYDEFLNAKVVELVNNQFGVDWNGEN